MTPYRRRACTTVTAITKTRFNSGMVSPADNTCFQNVTSKDIHFIRGLFRWSFLGTCGGALALQHYRLARQTRNAHKSSDGTKIKIIPFKKSCDTGAIIPTERVALKVAAIPVLSVGDNNLVVAAIAHDSITGCAGRTALLVTSDKGVTHIKSQV
jgi:hypothetical protein